MEQKIVIKLCMPDHKSRSKAMKTAVSFSGVASVALAKDDQMEVKGIEVDATELINCLRKKFATKTCCLKKKKGHATLVTVEEIKKQQQTKPPEKPKEPPEKPKEPPKPAVCGQCGCCTPCPCRRPMFVCVDEYPGSYCSRDPCSIM